MIVYSTRYPHVRGGVDSMIISLCEELRQKHDIVLFTAGDWEDVKMTCSLTDRIKSYCKRLRTPYYQGFSLRNLIAWMFEFPRTLRQLMKLVRHERVEVIHLHTLQIYQIYFLILRKLGGPPYVLTLHGSEILAYPKRQWPTRVIWRSILRNATFVNVVSFAMKDEARVNLPFVKDLAVIPNGLSLEDFEKLSRKDLEGYLGFSLPQAYFSAIGALRNYKGHDVAIKAWASLQRENSEVHLFIVGDGELREEYERLIRSLDCTHSVSLLGHLPQDVALSLASYGLGVLLLSRSEGLSYALLEAGSLELPLVCTDIPTFTNVVTDKVHALVVPMDDSDAVAEAVAWIVQHSADALSLGRSFGKLVRESYSAQNMADRYCLLYSSALNRD